jgi:hypothetical protein
MNATAIIALRAPQWSGDPRLPGLIELATEQTGDALQRSGKFNMAVALRVMHGLALEAIRGGNPGTGTDGGSNSVGQIVSETEGQLSRSYADVSSHGFSVSLSATVYGQELQDLVKGSVFPAMTRAPGFGVRR